MYASLPIGQTNSSATLRVTVIRHKGPYPLVTVGTAGAVSGKATGTVFLIVLFV